jgi:hypothetical protein
VERPKVEPEIIPPGWPDGREWRARQSTDPHHAHFVRIETRGLFAVVLALLTLGVVTAALLALLLGIVLLWIPLGIGFALALIVWWLFRGRRR